jgi:DHA1 family multidrug resistance protein-like MFS transporter
MSPDRSTDPRWRRLVAAVCMAQATAIVGFDFTLPFIPLYLQHDLGVHGLARVALWAGLIGFGPAIPATIFGPVWGRLADRVGYRMMLLRAMSCAALMLALMGFAPSAGVLLLLRMVQGALTGTVFAAQALVAAAAPEKEMGKAMGLLQMSVFVGATIGPLAGGAVADLLGYRAAYVGAGLLLFVATCVVVSFVREPPRRAATREQKKKDRPSMRSLLVTPAFATAVLLTALIQLASTAQFPIVPLMVQDLLGSVHAVASATGWVMAAAGLAAGAGSYLAGRLQRRLGLKPLLVVCLALSSLLLAPQALAGSFLTFLLLRCCAALAFGGLISLVGTLAALSSPSEAKGTAFGLLGAASSLGFGAGPLLGGSLVGLVGIRPVFVISAIALATVPAAIGAASLLRPVIGRLRSRAPRLVADPKR